MDVNRVLIAGNLTRDPELKYTSNGKTMATVTVAVNRKFKTANGEAKEETNFIRVVVWGKQAEIVKQYCQKGKAVFVEGRLRVRSYDTENGQRRTSSEVIAERIQFLGYNKNNNVNQPSEEVDSEENPELFE